MSHFEDIALSQRVISELADVSVATVNRYVNKHRIESTSTAHQKTKTYSIDDARKIVATLRTDQLLSSKKTHMFYNFKGGVGKTSICFQTSAFLALMGFRVLAIDLDMQGHLTSCLGCQESGANSMYDVMFENVPIQRCIKFVFPGLDLIPSNLSLSKLEGIIGKMDSEHKDELIKKPLSAVRDNYDFILIDTDPSMGQHNKIALNATDFLHIIAETQPLALEGLSILIDEIKSSNINKDLQFSIVPNKYELKTITSQKVLGALRHHYKDAASDVIIRRCEDFNRSALKKIPIALFCNKKYSVAFEDLLEFANDFISRFTTKQSKAA